MNAENVILPFFKVNAFQLNDRQPSSRERAPSPGPPAGPLGESIFSLAAEGHLPEAGRTRVQRPFRDQGTAG